MMISCKKATELIEKRDVVPLSGMEKIQYHMHLFMCKTCSAFQKKSKTIDLGIEQMMALEKDSDNYRLSEAMKGKIKEKLS
jgi:hypothetical protein